MSCDITLHIYTAVTLLLEGNSCMTIPRIVKRFAKLSERRFHIMNFYALTTHITTHIRIVHIKITSYLHQ